MTTAAGSPRLAADLPPSTDRRPERPLRWVVNAAMWLGASLVAASAGIHLHLWLEGYRNIPTIGTLFLVQSVAGFVLAAAVALLRRPSLAMLSALFLLATIGGLLTSAWFGLFGFRDSFDAPYAGVSLFVEGAGAVVLCVAGLLGFIEHRRSAGTRSG